MNRERSISGASDSGDIESTLAEQRRISVYR
jgi:hypothetical protein